MQDISHTHMMMKNEYSSVYELTFLQQIRNVRTHDGLHEGKL